MLLISLFLSSHLVFAADISSADLKTCKESDIQKSNLVKDDIKKKMLETCIANAKSKIDTTNLEESIKSKKAQECEQQTTGMLFWKEVKSGETERCSKWLEQKNAEVTKLSTELDTQRKAVTDSEAKYNADISSVVDKAQSEIKAGIKDNFKTMRLSIYDQKLTASDAALKLSNMARAMDNSAMGLYLRDRFAGLLNSEAFCKAEKQCGTTKKSINASDLNAVFNSSMKTKSSDVDALAKSKVVTPEPAKPVATPPAAVK